MLILIKHYIYKTRCLSNSLNLNALVNTIKDNFTVQRYINNSKNENIKSFWREKNLEEGDWKGLCVLFVEDKLGGYEWLSAVNDFDKTIELKCENLSWKKYLNSLSKAIPILMVFLPDFRILPSPRTNPNKYATSSGCSQNILSRCLYFSFNQYPSLHFIEQKL